MNQLRLAVAASYIAKAAPDSALAFLTKLAEKRERLGPEASLYIDMEIVLLKLKEVLKLWEVTSEGNDNETYNKYLFK